MNCINATYNEYGRLECKAGDIKNPQLCPYQKYCHQKSKWENSPGMEDCKRRYNMSEEKKVINEEKIVSHDEPKKKPILEDKVELIEKKEQESKKDINLAEIKAVQVEKKEETKIVQSKRRGQIIVVSTFSNEVAVKFDDGNLEMVKGYTDRKVGDFIEI